MCRAIVIPRQMLWLACLAGLVGAPYSTSACFQTLQEGPVEPKLGTHGQQPSEGTIHVRVALVSAPVVVTDASDEPVLDLEKEAFHLVDNGIDQTIEAFELGGEPLSAVLLFETSSRIASLLPALRKSATVFTQTIVGPSGEAAILSYDYTVGRLLPFTMDHDSIEKIISGLRAGNSGLRLYDALSQAVELLSDRSLGRRRAIIVVGEASDGGSEKELGEVLRQAQLANVVIYIVGLSPIAAALRAEPSQAAPLRITPSGIFGSRPTFPGTAQTPTSEQQYSGNIDLLGIAEWAGRNVKSVVKENPLEVAAAASGGTFQSVQGDRTFEKAVDAIGGELNSQYILSYRPIGSDIAGYHQIKVTVDRAGTKVRTRPGYYLEVK
jgi:VWFA-related protein